MLLSSQAIIHGSVFFLTRLEKLGLWVLGLLAADEGIANTFTWVSINYIADRILTINFW